SKAMYVMTPFTSLLVLENEDLYTQYKVDRGRKDHWAMYAAPQKIPVVYEPEPGQPDPKKLVQKLPAKDVIKSVVVRIGPCFIDGTNAQGQQRLRNGVSMAVDFAFLSDEGIRPAVVRAGTTPLEAEDVTLKEFDAATTTASLGMEITRSA